MTNLFSKTQSAALALAAGIAGAMLIATPSAQATVAITSGSNPQPREELVLFGTSQSGTTITGTTNISNTGVQITSTQALQTAGVGTASLEVASPATSITGDVTAASSGNIFTDFIFNALVTAGSGATGGATTIVAVANDGTFSQDVTLGSGDNFFTIIASGGETLDSVSLNLASGTSYSTFLHLGISGITPVTTVPEPASLVLLGSALLGFGLIRRRKA